MSARCKSRVMQLALVTPPRKRPTTPTGIVSTETVGGEIRRTSPKAAKSKVQKGSKKEVPERDKNRGASWPRPVQRTWTKILLDTCKNLLDFKVISKLGFAHKK